MNRPSTPWIKLQDFTHSALFIALTNSTTNTAVKEDQVVELTEITARGMVLRMPRKTCSVGHLLLIQLKREQMEPPGSPDATRKSNHIQVTSRVMEAEVFNATSELVVVQIYQANEAEWNEFVQFFDEYQKNATQVIKRILE